MSRVKLEVISADAGAAFAFHMFALAPCIANQRRRCDFAYTQLAGDISERATRLARRPISPPRLERRHRLLTAHRVTAVLQ